MLLAELTVALRSSPFRSRGLREKAKVKPGRTDALENSFSRRGGSLKGAG